MGLAILKSRALAGMNAPSVTVEVHLANGLPSFTIVGLPDTEVREARDRVRAALQNSCFEFPCRRIVVNLAPADLPKDSGRFDLPIALGILAASDQIPATELHRYEFVGELSLTGALRPIRGALAMASAMQEQRATQSPQGATAQTSVAPNAAAPSNTNPALSFIVPRANADEAALAQGICVLPADSLLAVCAHFAALNPDDRLIPHLSNAATEPMAGADSGNNNGNNSDINSSIDDKSDRRIGNGGGSGSESDSSSSSKPASISDYPDFSEVKGQLLVKRALEIAAAGSHSALMVGPPGAGKSMLAARLPGILPPMTEQQALEAAALQSISGTFTMQRWKRRPYRAPHHTASAVALVGGGSVPRPGEISLAHHGVLFLDELPEFSRHVLEVLREPLESGHITISRAARQADFPACFQLIAAMNPCPCGYFGDAGGNCHCTPDAIARYQGKISGPLLDRIDIRIPVAALPAAELIHGASGEASNAILKRVTAAFGLQLARQGKANSRLSAGDIAAWCVPEPAGAQLLQQAMERLNWSARAYHRVLKLARTIADLAGAPVIAAAHVAEAIQLRRAVQEQ